MITDIAVVEFAFSYPIVGNINLVEIAVSLFGNIIEEKNGASIGGNTKIRSVGLF